jgi:cytochrome c peroxidase
VRFFEGLVSILLPTFISPFINLIQTRSFMMMRKLPYAMLAAGFGLSLSVQAAQWEALPESAPIPADNPQSEAKIELGKVLFFDPRISSTGTVSCNSCHNVMEGGDDSRPNSFGIHGKQGGRSAPTVWNAAFLSVQFWDGRAATLEEQAVGPVANPIEMGMASVDVALDRIKQIPEYIAMFKAAFGDDAEINSDTFAKAVAAYERTLITPNTPYDKFVKGDKSALTEQQQNGMKLFAETGCTTCHNGANFSGPQLEMGQGFFMKFPTFADNDYVSKYQFMDDTGRHDATKNDADKHMWRVPTLRNIALTAPYFHNGAVATLDEAVRVMAKTQLNKDLSDAEVADITAFLEALTGEFPAQTMPRLPVLSGKTIID